MKLKKNIRKLTTALLAGFCMLVSTSMISSTTTAYAFTADKNASTYGKNNIDDTLNVVLSRGGTFNAYFPSNPISEGVLTDTTSVTNNVTTSSASILLDNTSYNSSTDIHINIGKTAYLNAPAADTNYSGRIGFAGVYKIRAAGGKGGNINSAYDASTGLSQYGVFGGYGSEVASIGYAYNSGQTIIYRLGSNGEDVNNFANYNSWDTSTNVSQLLQGNAKYDLGLYGDTANVYKAYSVTGGVGTASFIQVSGNEYLIAGGGAAGTVTFARSVTNGASSFASIGNHADVTPTLPDGQGFFNPGSTAMSALYNHYGPGNVNYGRIAGATVYEQVRDSFGTLYDVPIVTGWLAYNGTYSNAGVFNHIYPGYSGIASANGSGDYITNRSRTDNEVRTNGFFNRNYTGSPYIAMKCDQKTITITNPLRSGYSFAGWDCSSGVTATNNGNGTYTFKITATNTTITAKWVPLTTKVTFHRNTSTYDNVTAEQTFTYDVANQKFTDKGWTRIGYKLLGWSHDKNAIQKTYEILSGVSNEWINTYTPRCDLYAVWKPNTYTIKYDGNGSTGGSTDSSSHTYDTPKTLTPNEYTKDGYEFDGWNINPDGSGTSYKDKESVKNLTPIDNETITLYAQWKNLNPVNVKLFAVNGDDTYVVTDTSANDTTVTKWVNTPYTLYANAEDPGDGISKADIDRIGSKNKELFDSKTYNAIPKLTKENATFKEYDIEGTTSLVLTVTDAEGAKPDRPLTGSTSTKKMNLKVDTKAPTATISVSLGTYQNPYDTSSKKKWQGWSVYNSKAYGAKVAIKISDENEYAAGGKQDVSGIKHAWLSIYDTDNPDNKTDVELVAGGSSNIYNYSYNELLNINTMFTNVMNLTYEVHAIDVAGNEMQSVTTTTERKPEVYSKVERLTKDDGITDSLLFKAGFRGRLYIYTTGWVDTLDLGWPECIVKSGQYDIAHGEPGMIYDATLIMNGLSKDMELSSDPGVRLLQQAILASEYTDENNLSSKAFMLDANKESTGFTRCYVFDFWIPVYIGLEENPYHIDMNVVNQLSTKITANKYLLNNTADSVSVETVTSMGEFDLRIGDGSIMDNVHSSIIN